MLDDGVETVDIEVKSPPRSSRYSRDHFRRDEKRRSRVEYLIRASCSALIEVVTIDIDRGTGRSSNDEDGRDTLYMKLPSKKRIPAIKESSCSEWGTWVCDSSHAGAIIESLHIGRGRGRRSFRALLIRTNISTPWGWWALTVAIYPLGRAWRSLEVPKTLEASGLGSTLNEDSLA